MFFWILACASSVPGRGPNPDAQGSTSLDETTWGDDDSASQGDDSGTDVGGTNDSGTGETKIASGPDPVILVHGINGSADDFATYRSWLADAGYPEGTVVAETYVDPSWGCNVDNATELEQWIDALLAKTGASKVDVVAHSMGTLSSRYFLERLGGEARIDAYVTLGGMHNGLESPCWSPLDVCVWQELCETGEFITDLHAFDVGASAGRWTSIASNGDDSVTPANAYVDGAENIVVDGVAHDGAEGFQESAAIFALVLERL